MRGHDSRRRDPTPCVFQKLARHLMPYRPQAHQDPRVRPVVVCEEERARISLEQDIPVEEVNAYRRSLAVFLQPREQLLTEEERWGAVRSPFHNASEPTSVGA